MLSVKNKFSVLFIVSLLVLIMTLSPCLVITAGALQGVKGDVDHNGKLDAKDAMIIQRSTIGLAVIAQEDIEMADVNGDGIVSAKDVIVVLRCVIGLSSSLDKKTGNAENQTPSFKDQVVEVARLVNIERAKEGLDPLVLDETLCKYSDVRANELYTDFSHSRPDGRTWYTTLDDDNIPFLTAGENIAAGQKTPQMVVDSWMNSEGHRRNILNPSFHKIGVGYAVVPGDLFGTYWEEMFTD